MTTHDPIRALLTEMADELDHNRQCLLDDRSLTHPLADRARAALAAALEGEGPPAVTISALLHPAYEPGDGSADGAQMVGMQWWHPVMGCDSLQLVVDNARNIPRSRWARPAAPPADLPPDYIDEWITNPRDRALLEVFHKACNAEGGSADEVILRGLKAVLQDGLSRSHRLQQENHRFREPERTILCDILANGTLLPDLDGTRYGIPPTPLEGEVGELAAWLYRLADERTCNRRRGIRPHPSALTRAAVLLEQLSTAHPERLRHCPTHGQQPATAWGCPECVRELREQLSATPPAPVPVAVSERPWEREGWCDDEDRCWCMSSLDGPPPRWWLVRPEPLSDGWVLPAHALPIPTTTPAGQEGA